MLIFCLSLVFGFHVQSQDLITQTQNGNFYEKKINPHTKNPLAQKFLGVNLKSIDQVSLFEYKERKDLNNDLKQIVDDAVFLQLNQNALKDLLKNQQKSESISLTIPVNDKYSFTLLLSPSQALTDDFILETSDGKRIQIEENGLFFNGIVQGKSESFATVSIHEDYLQIIASDDSGNYILSKIAGTVNEYVLFNDQKLKSSPNITCALDDTKFALPEKIEDVSDRDGGTLKVRTNVEVYVEVDYSLYTSNGNSSNNTMNYVLDLFRSAVSVYEKESISLRLNRVFIWTTNNDPFNNINGDFAILEDQLNEWACDDVDDADIGHYISADDGLIGLADSIGEFCDMNDDFICGDDETSRCVSLGMSTPFVEVNQSASTTQGFTVASWELYVFVHEMGHVFGSPHTHACAWNGNNTQIDDCGNVPNSSAPCFNASNPIIPSNGGTMMSYCWINLALGFGTQPGNLIRSTINNSSCIGNYELICPDVETIELDVSSSATYDAREEVLIHDANITTGFSPNFTGGERTIIYGNFSCPVGAGMRITTSGCN